MSLNPFCESYTSNSSRTKFNRRKHEDSYFSRVSNNTVEWINHKTFLEQFFYVVALIIFVLLFTAIYFIYTEHYVFQNEPLIMANSTPESAGLAISTKLTINPTTVTTSPAIKPSTTTIKASVPVMVTMVHHHHVHHHHYVGPEIRTEASSKTSTTTSVQTETASFWPTQGATLISTATETTTQSVAVKNVEELSTSSSTFPDHSTNLSPTEIRNEFNKFIEDKISKIIDGDENSTSSGEIDPSENVTLLLHLANNVAKHERSPSLCSFIGLSHLATPLRIPDYYWFRPQNDSYEGNSFEFLDEWITICKDNCSATTESTSAKLNRFLKSCMKPVQDMMDYKRFVSKLGFKSRFAPKISKSEVVKLFKSLDYQGLINFKPISRHPSFNTTINLVDRDDYPFATESYSNGLSKDLIDNQFRHLYGSDLNNDVLTESFTLCESIQNITNTDLNLMQISSLHESQHGITVTWDSGFMIEKEPEYLEKALNMINSHNLEPEYFYYCLLINNLKKNLIHLNDDSRQLHYEYFDLNAETDRHSFCRNMATLPFGLMQLMNHLKSSGSINSQLALFADNLMSKLIKTLRSKFSDSQFSRPLLKELCYNIFNLLIADKVLLDDEYIDKLYNSLEITDNYFNNIQSIRSWLRFGYKEGCLLNYLSV